MDFFLMHGADPWGQPIVTHVSWGAVWVSAFIGLTFLVAHSVYMALSANRKSSSVDLDALEAMRADLPPRITRHTLMARLFHWVMAAAMFVLLITAFFPLLGFQFAWVTWHWIAGLVLTGAVIYHIVHASFWLDFWSIWVGPGDILEFKAELLREAGQQVPGPKPAKYPLGNRLYHLILVTVSLVMIGSGLIMMPRIETPFFERNPYFLGDATWGYIYAVHGLVGVSLVGLTIAHVYFAARPEKWWVTRAMILGWITRREYVKHHEPNRWPVNPDA